jgi:hypothetical protein
MPRLPPLLDPAHYCAIIHAAPNLPRPRSYFLCYLLSPKTCHSFVGYLEEEAVRALAGLGWASCRACWP